jgi:single-strand DNA-binding protein
MATLNKVMLIGRLTKDPEAPRVLPNSGSTVVKFRFAVGRSKKNEAGGWDKDPNQLYIDCEVYSRADSKRNLPDLITRFAKQGSMLYLEGRLVFEEWEDKKVSPPNNKRSKHKLVVDSIEFLDSKQNVGGEDVGSGGGASRQTNGGRGASTTTPDEGGGDVDDHGGGGTSGGDGDPIPF